MWLTIHPRVFHNSRNRPVTVARGPVPRERHVGEPSRSRCNTLNLLRSYGPKRAVRWTAAWRGTGPRPTVKGGRSAAKKPSGYRSAGACPPRALDCADDGEGQDFPQPYVKGRRFFHRSAGACPLRRWAIYETPSTNWARSRRPFCVKV